MKSTKRAQFRFQGPMAVINQVEKLPRLNQLRFTEHGRYYAQMSIHSGLNIQITDFYKGIFQQIHSPLVLVGKINLIITVIEYSAPIITCSS